MKAIEHRRFTLADSLILIAGLAAGLGLVKATSPGVTPGQIWDAFAHPRGGWSLWHAFGITVELGAILVIPFVAAWTPACLVVQVTNPRPPWRRLRRQPGFVACLIASVISIAAVVIASTCIWFSLWEVSGSSGEHLKAHILGGILAGSGVLWGWVTMRLCGVCRPSPAWRDRLGRFTGAVWIVLGAICAVYICLAIG